MKVWALFITVVGTIACLAACGKAGWPDGRFPPETEIARVLFSKASPSFRETCEAIVVELTDQSATRLVGRIQPMNSEFAVLPPLGWQASPLRTENGTQQYFDGAFNGCVDDGNGPLGDLPGALERPGAHYKIFNGGEGIGIIMPRAKLAGFFYFG